MPQPHSAAGRDPTPGQVSPCTDYLCRRWLGPCARDRRDPIDPAKVENEFAWRPHSDFGVGLARAID
jgi:hypothetical protein